MNDRHLQARMRAELHDRRLYQRAISMAMDYVQQSTKRPTYPQQEALDALRHFDEDMPPTGSDTEAILSMLHSLGAPATIPQIGGRYYGFVTGSAVPAGLAAKSLTTFWDQNAALHVLSPVASKLETVVEGWLRQVLGLPSQVVAGFVSGSSLANYCGLAAARYRLLERLGWNVNEQGLMGAPALRVVAGRHAHSTILKAVALLGLGRQQIMWVDVDEQGRIQADRMPPLDEQTLVILQAGNVNSGAFDDFERICDRARQAGAWIHIDGAFGLWAAACPSLKHLTAGCEIAHSWALDAHKTLNAPYDNGIVLCSDGEALRAALHMSGSYIVVSEERDGMFYTPEMSRRARIFELWATMKYLGATGIDSLVSSLHERAREFAEQICALEGFQVVNEVVFNQVLVQCDSDQLTRSVLRLVQEQRDCWVGGAKWFERDVIRVSLSSWMTDSEDVIISVKSFARALDRVQSDTAGPHR